MTSRKRKSSAESTTVIEGEPTTTRTEVISELTLDSTSRPLIDQLINFHNAGVQAQKYAVMCGMLCGHNLLELKNHYGHGFFGKVCNALSRKYRISDRTFQRYMVLAKNKAQIIERLRELNPTPMSDLPDEDVLAGTSMAKALRLVADCRNEQDDPQVTKDVPTTDGTEAKSQPRTAKWRECQLPIEFSEGLSRVWDHIDHFISDVDEAVEVPAGVAHPAVRLATDTDSMQGHVLVNGLRKQSPTELLKSVAEGFRTKAITEAYIAVPCGMAPQELSPFGSCPRLVLRQHPQLHIANDNGRLNYPCSVMVLVLANCERNPEIAAAFNSVGDLYVPVSSAK